MVCSCGSCRTIQSKGLFLALLIEFRHCCNAYLRWSAIALHRKVQGFLAQSLESLALEQSQLAFKPSFQGFRLCSVRTKIIRKILSGYHFKIAGAVVDQFDRHSDKSVEGSDHSCTNTPVAVNISRSASRRSKYTVLEDSSTQNGAVRDLIAISAE